MSTQRTAIIVGGGVSALATALALHRKDIESDVFEQSSVLRATGGALLLWSNAVRALRALGVEDAVMAVGARVERIEFRTSNGALLTTLRVGDLSRAADAPSLIVPRAELITILARALPPSAIHVDARFSGYAMREDGRVVATFADGAERTADVLVGADGLHSTVRTRLRGHEPFRETEQVAFVGVTDAPGALELGIPIATVGAGLRFWAGPLRGGGVYWYATVREFDGVSRDPNLAKRQLLDLFDGWHYPIEELIDSTVNDQLTRTVIVDCRPVERWGAGPVTLVGDAAHPCTPDLGQGACQALESAVSLAALLAERDVAAAEALRSYERQRMRRTARVTELSFVTAMQSAVRQPVACLLRDLGIKTLLARVAEPELRWLLT